MPFAAAGMRGPMFSYAEPAGTWIGYVHDGPYAVFDVQTTGLRPGEAIVSSRSPLPGSIRAGASRTNSQPRSTLGETPARGSCTESANADAQRATT